MRKIHSLNIPYEIHDNADGLPLDEQQLLTHALEATDRAYAVYSGFHVGCALLLEGGEILTGNNQENKAFPSSLCAERTALYFAGASGKGTMVRKMAIRGRSINNEVTQPVTPCGACRQVMLEYEKLSQAPITVLMQGESGNILKVEGIAGLLVPFDFDIEF